MNWDDLRIFLAVARAGRILAASRRLELNHATVSRRLSALEEAMGVRLFTRTTTGSELTAAGRKLVGVAEAMEAATIAAGESVAVRGGEVAGVVRVGAPDGFGVAYLAPRLHELSQQHKELRIQLVPVPHAFSLSKREVDIAIMMDRPSEGRLVASKLVDYSLALYASRGYAERHTLPQAKEDFRDHRLVGYVPDLVMSPSLDCTPDYWDEWTSCLEISSAMGQAAAIRSGAGIGVLHTYIARGDPELVPLDGFMSVRRSYWLAYHEATRMLRNVQAVADFITSSVERDRLLFR